MTQMTRDDFEEVEVLRDGSVVAVISRNRHTGYYSYGFFKEYAYRGGRKRSAFFSRRHSLSLRRLIPRVEQYLDSCVDLEAAKHA